MDPRRQGKPTEELFMRQPSSQSENQTIEPLRIHKLPSPISSPPSGSSSLEGATSSPYPYPQPQSPPPNRPLPYPVSHTLPGRTYTPPIIEPMEDARRRFSGQQDPSSARARFTADENHRPANSSYSHPLNAHQNGEPHNQSHQDVSDGEGLFQMNPRRQASPPQPNNHPSIHAPTPQQYYPPPSNHVQGSNSGALGVPNPNGVNRFASTASVSTTRAARGSPPPPETPATDFPARGGIEARYAAAGIAGASTLTSLQAQNLAAAQRQPTVFSPPPQDQNIPFPTPQQQQQQQPPPQSISPQSTQSSDPIRRRWTPTEEPGSQPFGPTTAYQGNGEAAPMQSGGVNQLANANQSTATSTPHTNPLDLDMQRLQVSDEPPPAYSSVSAQNHNYPVEKRTANAGANTQQPQTQPTTTPITQQTHPAYANDPVQPQLAQQPQPNLASPQPSYPGVSPTHTGSQQSPSPVPSQSSPPPLPEGWIAHLDPNSSQYYYIHLTTQSTQWEFPKGPTPLNFNEPPLSPTGTLVNHPLASPLHKPLASPGFPSKQDFYRESVLNMTGMSTPTAAGFTGLPPASGVDLYKVGPTNGVYFGPYLRYTNMDADSGIWFGSILLVTDGPNPPTIHIHQSVDLSPNPRQLKANHIYQHQRWLFYRYDIDLRMEEDRDAKWTYAVTSHLGCTRYEFLVAARMETSWRFITHSGNDFALNVSANERTKIGGIGHMWKDILQKHQEVGGFHAQLGLGNQISADRLWKEIPSLRQWTAMSGKENRKNAVWTAAHEEDITHAYFHYYTSHFDQPLLREAFAQIPHVLTLDDHDIFDGFGSYPEHMQFSNMFKNIGRIGIEMYLLFQHHTTLEILRNVNNDLDLFTVTGTGWHFVKYLGPAVVVVGADCRSERNPHQVMAGPTYQGLFPKVAMLPPNVQHCIWMIPVPLIYPRLEAAESFASTMATGKKAVTGTYNALSKVTSSVAGVVGAKSFVGEGFNSVKKAVGKSGLMSSVLSPFGEIDLLDELRDQWTHESKDLERTYLIRTLQGIAHNKSIRMTFFSGDVNCCGAGMVHDPSHPGDHKTMYQVISSSVVNAPPSSYMLRMLHPNSYSSANRPLYIPANGHRSTPQNPTDTKEDMLEMFGQDVNGQPREMKRLMGRRNYAVVVAYDPQMVHGAFAGQQSQTASRISLAVDFFVQADGGAGFGGQASNSVKYGPLIVPGLEYGR